MSAFFLKIVNMSISAGWIVLAVLALRLLLRKAPKWITVLLWGIVAQGTVLCAVLLSPYLYDSFIMASAQIASYHIQYIT